MSGEVFRRVGRGGAGNWYSKKDVEDAEKLDDVEAQRSKAPSPLPRDHQEASSAAARTSPATPTPYARGGRGGAGNFFDPQSVAAVAAERQDEAKRLQTATAAVPVAASTNSRPHKPATYSGRGGAGNWTGSAAAFEQEQEAAAERQRKQQVAIEEQIRQDVDSGLAIPAPAYHGIPAREGGRGPAKGL